MSIQDLPLAARPREKLLSLGVASLSDVELLAIFLRTGTRGRGVLSMAADLLKQFGSLAGLLGAEGGMLKQVKGLGGPAKRAELIAILELARRACGDRLRERQVFEDPRAVVDYLQLHLARLPYESFAVLFLDTHHRLIEFEQMFRGTLTQTCVYPRELVVRALHHQAVAVVLAHNHPSGQVRPSREDEALTRNLKAALALVDVRVLDHFIVAPGLTCSMAHEGLL